MKFVQDFRKDFETLCEAIEGPEIFAFSRFADGERVFCADKRKGRTADGWRHDGQPSEFSAKMKQALTARMPGYYLGLSCACCDRVSAKWYQQRVKTPKSRQTFSNIFVNANYRAFQEFANRIRLLDTAVFVGSFPGADIPVPKNAINPPFDYSAALKAMRKVNKNRVICVAAGPLSCVLIHEYWQNKPKAKVVDIGSAYDEQLHGRKTRKYQRPGSPTSNKVCTCLIPQ